MNLVYKEYIQFLKEKGIDIEKYGLEEGFFWLDRQIIKAYDKLGNIHKILRMNIQDDLSIIVKDYKKEEFEIESWMETVERNKEKLIELETESLELIKNSRSKYDGYKPIVLTSTGKDSQVVRYLAEQVLGDDVWKVFNNTTMDCAETYRMAKNTPNCTIVNPNEGFYQWQKRTNFIGNRTSRACCLLYKEKMIDKALDKDGKYLSFMGMRNDESNTRSGYQDEWINTNWAIKGMVGILCIRKWTEEDIWLYTLLKNIEINKKYKYGYHRVGCNVTCAFYTKSTWVLDQYWYPKMYKRWHNIIDEDFTKNNKELIMNCTQKEYHMCWNGMALRKIPTKEVIGEFAERNKLDINIAENYFNHYCEECDNKFNNGEINKRKKIKDKTVLAMNMKFLGRNTTKFYCKKHLMELLSITKEQWDEYIEGFKSQGCNLF